ncbi:uncharacterized protein PFL1_04382 [Pseudozyma flocculosa PF-1]|uniref:Uncharacterized protein n=2 Tax=Pseudozyma flocculosa TaxID=84751 RepID=A0A5C3FD67_9BASI|nr:uncharacterized protein PFL1_04382 [Pseudozyma flocculosa PF-1]EPQ28055.1 hypothetical protein PFL1_04382 [Pseudozyma flocculosa PF-1]SPO42210.1 uncharacterized protein PSFLO_07693 [Pseudozyma flocculosa]
MVTHSYARSPACYDDPVFARTHFLARVASEDIGVEQAGQRHKLSSAKLDDLQGWDSRWFHGHRITNDDDDDDSSCSSNGGHGDYGNDAESRPHYRPRQSQASSSLASSSAAAPLSVANVARLRSSTVPHQVEHPSHLGQTPADKVRSALLSASVTAKHRVRHDRSASAPEPRLLPAQPLSINTAQPLRLAQPDLCTMSPLAYPVGIFDAADGSSSTDLPATQATPAKRRSTSRSTSSSPASPSSPAAVAGASARHSSRGAARPTVIECSESDGSCHNDAGDADPEGQLAAEIIRLRNARKLDAPREAASPAHPLQPKIDEGLKLTTSDYAPEDDDADHFDLSASDGERSDAIIHSHASHPILRFAEAMLEFGTCSLERFTSDDGNGAQVSVTVGRLPSSRELPPQQERPSPRRISTTPKDLGREAQLMRLKRQESTSSARSSRSNSVNSLATWFQGSEPKLSLRARASRQATSLLSLPSLLAPSASEGSIDTSTTASSSMPASPRPAVSRLSETDAEDDLADADAQRHFAGLGASGRPAYPSYVYGLDGYPDDPAPHLAPSSAGMDVVFQRFDDDLDLGKHASDGAASKPAAAHVTISPLWSEDLGDASQQPSSIWNSLFSS